MWDFSKEDPLLTLQQNPTTTDLPMELDSHVEEQFSILTEELDCKEGDHPCVRMFSIQAEIHEEFVTKLIPQKDWGLSYLRGRSPHYRFCQKLVNWTNVFWVTFCSSALPSIT